MRRVFPALLLIVVLQIPGCRSASSDAAAKPFRVERGSSAREIAAALSREGLIEHPRLFLFWVRLGGSRTPAIRPGSYVIPAGRSAREILQQLRKGPQPARVTFPEGWMARQMAALLEANNVVKAAAFMERVERDKLEGYLFPDTYVFDQEIPVDTVINRMRQRFQQQLPSDWVARQKVLRLNERQLITLASIVEREARVASERPMIASVYHNRLRKGMRLEADPTVQYALREWKPRLLYRDLEIVSPYNTYRNKGLPPGPICNPGAGSLHAAVHPAVSDKLFFVAQGDGSHYFSRTYQEHLNAIRQRKR